MTEDKARRYITDLFSVVGTDSVLVVLHTGGVRRLRCPFMVIAKVSVSHLKKGGEYTVEAVKMTLQLQDVFIIEGKAYYVWYFAIKI